MNYYTLVYLSGKGFALKFARYYKGPAISYYMDGDQYFQNTNQNEIDFHDYIQKYENFNNPRYYDYNDFAKQMEPALELVDNVQLVKEEKNKNNVTFQMLDPNYREVLKNIKKKSEADAKKAAASAKRYTTMTGKRSMSSQLSSGKDSAKVVVLDPDDPKNWEIEITISNKGPAMISSCQCSDYYCQHKMAMSIYLFQQRILLEESYIRSKAITDKSSFISTYLIAHIHASSKGGSAYVTPERVQLLKTIAKEISSVDSTSYFTNVMHFILGLESEWDEYDARFLETYAPLIGAFYEDPYIRQQLEEPKSMDRFLPDYYGKQDKSNLVTFKREFKHFQTADQELIKGKGQDSHYKQFLIKFRDDGDVFLKYYAENVVDYYEDDLIFLERYTKNYAEAPDDVKTKILLKLDAIEIEMHSSETDFIKRKDNIISNFLQYFSEEDQILKLSLLNNYHVSLENYQLFNQETKELLAEKMQPTKVNLDYILNNVAVNFDDRKKADLLLKFAQSATSEMRNRDTGNILYHAACNISHHTLLSHYIASLYRLTELLQDNIQISDEDVTSYFRTDYMLDAYNNTIQTDYFVYAIHDYTEPENGKNKNDTSKAIFHFCERSGKIISETTMVRRFSNASLKRIAQLALAERKDEYEQKKQELTEEISLRIFEKTNKRFASKYRDLCTELQEERILFTETYKANISYLFDLSSENVLLGFKVGNTRDYIVKNANEFLEAFRNGTTITYGKDLVLTHDFENLNEEDRPVIRLLSPLKYRVTGNGPNAKRFLSLTGPMFSNVIELLKGRNVTVGETPTTVRLDSVDIKIAINQNYELIADYNSDTQTIIVSGARGYLYTKNTGGNSIIDCINANPDQLRLLDFVMHNGNVSIQPILNDFKKNIYSRFYDSFSVADSVKQDFKLSVIHINSYFDYENRTITQRTEYWKDNKQVPRTALKERMDIQKADAFEVLLTNLGFEGPCLSDESKILSFLKMDFSMLKRQASVYLSESLSNKKLVSLNRQVIRVSYSKSGLIDAVLEKSDYSEEELDEILIAMKKKKKFLLLSGDRIIDLDSDEAKEFRDTVKDLGLESGKLYKKKRLNMIAALKAFAHDGCCSVDRQLKNILEDVRSFKDYDIKTPNLSYEMRGYQIEGYRWLSVLSKYHIGGVLADDMGLGKTLQIIALIKADKTKKPSLIICPKSLVFNWMNEFARFDGETAVTEIYGLPDKRTETIRNIDYSQKTVYVTSYDSLRNDINEYTGTFNYCVLDEAQYIKNVTAQKSKSVKEIKADNRFALTGTPIENNLIDLWSIFDFIMPGYFEELSEFKSSAGDEDFHKQVSKRIGPFVLRRIKENVLSDLPEKYETILSCEMLTPQRKVYEALRKKARDAMTANEKAFDLLPILMQMRQACVDPAMCLANYTGESGKMKMLEELIPTYIKEGHRILLFSQFVKGLNQVEKLLAKHNIPYYLLTGDTSAKERSRMIDEFNSTNGIDIFLISLKAGGTGLNLTGADTVIHLDPWWNVAAENQATDRAHRIGQTKNVEVIKLISEDSIEQRVIELQNLKKDLIDRVISNDESSITNARLEDIAFILD